MRPTEITLDGFLSYRDPVTIDLAGIETASITGKVGSGKSSILDAITFCLYGVTRSSTKDGVIHTALDKTAVTLTFDHAGGQYRARRSTTRSGNTKAYLERLDEATGTWLVAGDADGKVGGTDKAIADLLGLSWTAFRASVLVEQGKSGAFAEASPVDRHKVLADILDLGEYDRLADRAKAQRTNVRAERQRVAGRVAELEGQLVSEAADRAEHEALTVDLQVAQTQAQQTSTRYEANRARVNQLLAAATEAEQALFQHRNASASAARERAHAVEALRYRQSDLVPYQKEADDVAAKVASIEPLRDKLAELEASLVAGSKAVEEITARGQSIAADISRMQAEQQQARGEITDVQARLDALTQHAGDAAECWACGQHLPPDLRDGLARDLGARISDLTARVGTLGGQIAEAERAKAGAAAEYGVAANQVKDATREVEQVRAALTEAEQAPKLVADTQERVAHLQKQISELQVQIEALDWLDDGKLTETLTAAAETARAEADAGAAQLARDEAAAREAEQKARSLTTRLAVAADRLEQYASKRKALASLAETDRKLAGEEGDLDHLIKAWSPTGVPRMILASAVDELNTDLDAELDRLSGGTLTAELSTSRETKGGTTKAEITLNVTGQDGTRPYETFSGGQRFLVDISLHLALARVLQRRRGATMGMLAVDEGWGTVEAEERTALLRALHELSDDFPLVLTVTHIEEVAAAMGTNLAVEMIGGTSVVTAGAA